MRLSAKSVLSRLDSLTELIMSYANEHHIMLSLFTEVTFLMALLYFD